MEHDPASGWEEVDRMNFFTRKRSASSAKERLQLVLVHDRTDLSPGQLESLKDDLIKAISK